MKHLVLIGILGVALQGAAQTFKVIDGDTFNRKDELGNKYGKWIEMSNSIQLEGDYVNGVRDGLWKGEETNLKEERMYESGWLLKRTTYFHDWLFRQIELNSAKDKVTWTDYHKNGEVNAISVFDISECTFPDHFCRPFAGIHETLQDHRIRKVVYNEKGKVISREKSKLYR